jgi:hypothetical protein
MEDIEDIEDTKDIEESFKFAQNPDSWQMKVQQYLSKWLPFPSPFPLPWLIIAAPIFVIGYMIASIRREGLFAAEFGLIAALGNAVVYFEMLVDDVADAFPHLVMRKREEVKELLIEWYQQTFWSLKDMIAGALLGVLLVVVWWVDPPVPPVLASTPGKAYIYAASFLVGFLGGSMLWAMFRIATLMLWLGKKIEIRPSVFDSSTSPLRAVSAVLWKVSFTAIAIYVSIILWLILFANRRGVLTMSVAITFGIIFMLYFIIPQWNVHKTLLKLKQKRLRKLVKQVDSTFDKVAQNPTRDNIQQLRSLFEVQQVVNGKSPWSFGITELLVLLGSVIVPLLILIIDWLIQD